MAMSLATASDAVYPVHPGKPPDGHFDVIMLLDGTRHHLPADAGATVFEFKQATEQLFAPRPGMLATLEGVDYFLDFGYRAMDSMATILDNWCLLHRTCGGSYAARATCVYFSGLHVAGFCHWQSLHR